MKRFLVFTLPSPSLFECYSSRPTYVRIYTIQFSLKRLSVYFLQAIQRLGYPSNGRFLRDFLLQLAACGDMSTTESPINRLNWKSVQKYTCAIHGLPRTNSISDCFLMVCGEKSARNLIGLLWRGAADLHDFFFFVVVLHDVDGLLDFTKHQIAMTIVCLYT